MLLALILVVLMGGNDGILVDMPSVRNGERGNDKVLCQVQQAEALNGTPDSILRGRFDSGVLLRVASVEAGYTVEDTVLVESAATPPEGGVDGLIIEATEHWGVEWAREALITVRFKESSNIVVPCKVGDSGERGPYQFMAGTWASTPYAELDPCDLEAATWAAAWFVSEGRWLEWTTWPR